MNPTQDPRVSIQGLGQLDAAVYRRWVRTAVVIVAIGYSVVLAADVLTQGWGYSAAFQAAVVLTTLVGLWLVGRGEMRWAVLLTLMAVWVDLQSTFALTGGVNDFGFVTLPVVVLAVGMVFGTIPAVVAAALTTLSTSALVAYALVVNDVPVTAGRAVYTVTIVSAAMFATAGLVSVAVRSFAAVLSQAEAAAQSLSDLIREAPDGILVLRSGGTVASANPEAVSILGQPEDQLVGRTLREILQDLSAETDVDDLGRLATPSEEGSPRTVWWQHGNRTRWVELTARVFGREDSVTRQVMLRDVTLRQSALEEQRIVRDQLEEGQRMEAVGRLAGGIAHDFGNLLTVVGNAADFIALDNDGETRHLAVEIRRAVDKAANLTTQLMAFARNESVQPVELDLREVIHAMDLGMRNLIGPRAQLKLELSEHVPPILGDRSQIEAVIFNLVKNAGDAVEGAGIVKVAVDPPGARVTGLEGSEYEVPHGSVVLRVTDDGVGMDADVLEHAFEPYYTTKTLGRGTGLGLSSVYGVVSQAGGELRVESRRGVGTSVHVLWPTARAAADFLREEKP